MLSKTITTTTYLYVVINTFKRKVMTGISHNYFSPEELPPSPPQSIENKYSCRSEQKVTSKILLRIQLLLPSPQPPAQDHLHFPLFTGAL